MSRKFISQTDSLFNMETPKLTKGYYSGDKPNPNLRRFIEEHAKPIGLNTDEYRVTAFNKPITSTKATAIYLMHSYHQGKKPHDAIREYIRHYTRPGDLVLDPFAGSGGTSLAALLEGRKAIAVDRSPASTFITKNYCSPVIPHKLRRAFQMVASAIQQEMDWLYGTVCDRCGRQGTIAYTVYSQVFQCPRCLKRVAFLDCSEAEGKTAAGKPKKIRVCPHCLMKGPEEEIRTSSETFGHIPVLQCYICDGGCRPSRSVRSHKDANARKRSAFEKHDLAKIKEIEGKPIPYWFPRHKMMNVDDNSLPWGAEWRPGRNFRTVAELFTKRNLWALASIRDAILKLAGDQKDQLLFALNAITLNCSRMYRYRKSLKGGFQQGTYYIPQESQIINVFRAFSDKVNNLCRAANKIPTNGDFIVSTQSACQMEAIPNNSIDYVFTDPPYSDTVQYGELNFIWEAWLDFDTTWHNEEIIVNDVRGKSELEWAAMMKQAMAECYRVLKPGRWLTLCFHAQESAWELVQDFMAEVGFIVDKSDAALFIESGQKSYNQLTADKSRLRDLVLNFRKPQPGETTATIIIFGEEDKTTFNEKVRQIIRDYIGVNPGSTKDRIYDEVVSRMVSTGQMEAHDFEELLRNTAEEVKTPVMKNLFERKQPDLFGTHEIGRWYLKEEELVVADAAETAREDAAAEKIGQFIKEYLKKNLVDEGVHYNYLFEHYIYAVKDKPRRQLAEFLSDYFYKTEQGTWRLPSSEEEERAKREARLKGLGRRVKHYIAQLEQGAAIPEHERPNDATLAEWIRHCKRAGLYDHGKLLYEKGGLNPDNLSEEAMVYVEEDYQVCVRMLMRA